MPGEQIASGKLVSTMLALVRSITRVCEWCEWDSVGGRERKRTDGISCVERHAGDE